MADEDAPTAEVDDARLTRIKGTVVIPAGNITWSSTASASASPTITGGSYVFPTTTVTTPTPYFPIPASEPKSEPKPEPKKLVELPGRVTKNVVIGFVEDNDEIVWSAKLPILDFHVDLSNEDGEGRITIVTSMEDAIASEKK